MYKPEDPIAFKFWWVHVQPYAYLVSLACNLKYIKISHTSIWARQLRSSSWLECRFQFVRYCLFMPELLEGKSHFESLQHILEALLPNHVWRIKGIWADATDEERTNWPIDHPARQGYVYKLGPNDPQGVFRGGGNPTSISPTFLPDETHPNSYTLPLETLELKDIHYSSRALLLNFGEAWLQVFLDHGLHSVKNSKLPIGSVFNTHVHPALFKADLGQVCLQDDEICIY